MVVAEGNLYRVLTDARDPCHGYLGRSRDAALEIYWQIRTFHDFAVRMEFMSVGAAFAGEENWQRMLPK